MPLEKFVFTPGINKESTSYAAEGGWFDGNNVRFRNGRAEKIGGWQYHSNNDAIGTIRFLEEWTALDGTKYIAVGTNAKFYVNIGGSFYDITPLRTDKSISNFTSATEGVSAGDPVTVTVTDSAHGAFEGDYVTFSGSSSFDGILAATLDANYRITSLVSADKYTIEVLSDSGSSGASSDQTPTAYYEIHIGGDSWVEGRGWGSATYGGQPSAFVMTELKVATSGTDPIQLDSSAGFIDPEAADTETPQYARIGGSSGEIVSYTEIDSDDLKGITRNVGNAAGWTVAVHPIDTSVDALVLNSDPPSTSDWVGYGSQSPVSAGSGLQLRTWYGDNFGEDFMFAPWEGDLYYWDKSVKTEAGGTPKDNPDGRAGTFSEVIGGGAVQIPDLVRNILVSEEDRHTIAFGVNDIGSSSLNPALIRWSTQGNPFDWNPSSTNTSGGQVLTPGSEIIAALRGRQEIMVWTDNALHSMRFIGPPYTFGFSLVSSPLTIMSPNAAVIADSTIYWMGRTSFYRYTGAVETMPCSVSQYVFSDIDYDQRYKIFVALNSKFNEVIWFYPSLEDASDELSPENSRYVAFNYLEGSWYIGKFDMTCTQYSRTSWLDVGQSANPVSGMIQDATTTPITSRLVEHDTGTDAFGSNLPSDIQSAYFDIGNGDDFMYINRIIPDMSFTDANGVLTSGSISISLDVKDFPNEVGDEVFNKTFESLVTPQVDQLLVRARGRQSALKYTTPPSSSGFGWRLGDVRLDLKTDGRK